MPEIRELQLSEFKEIYRNYMREDFPLMELRPLFAIDRVWERGGYAAYGYYEDGRLTAYASFYPCTESPCILLDYFAVVPDLRSQGIGTAFLRDLLPQMSSGAGIFGEAESVTSAKDEDERNTRQRRLDFYTRSGAVFTGVNCHLFGVDYNILCFPAGEDAPEREAMTKENYFDAVCGMYRELYRPVYGRLCKPYLSEDPDC